jgi:hypothetical protein
MRLLFAGIIGGMIGFLQLLIIAAIEAAHSTSPDFAAASDLAFAIFGCFFVVEALSVITLSIYRISPWILRLLRADWDADRTILERKKHSRALHAATIISTLGRRVILMIDHQTWDPILLVSLIVALAAFLIPRPSKREK